MADVMEKGDLRQNFGQGARPAPLVEQPVFFAPWAGDKGPGYRERLESTGWNLAANPAKGQKPLATLQPVMRLTRPAPFA